MPRSNLCILFLCLVSCLANSQTLVAQTIPVQRIRANPNAYLNQEIAIVGTIVRYLDVSGSSYEFYFEDDYGIQLRVVSTVEPPPIESRWQLVGLVALDAQGDPYLVESSRMEDGNVAVPDEIPQQDADGDGVPNAADRCPNSPSGVVVDATGCPESTGNTRLLLIAAGAISLGLLAWGLSSLLRRPSSASTPAVEATPNPDASRPPQAHAESSSGEFFSGETVRFSRPTNLDGTLKLLPGRLEVINGPDEGNEIRFVHPGGDVPEITFGRSEGPKFAHIQLPAPTVSRRHALLRFETGSWRIANFSETNPVVVNGNAMDAVGETRDLKDGDVLEFGEVSFKYHQK